MAPKTKNIVEDDASQSAGAGNDTISGTSSEGGAEGATSPAGGAGEDSVSGGGDARGLFNGADESKFDHDGDGKPGGSAPKAPEPAPVAPSFTLEQVSEMVTQSVAAALAARDAQAAEEAAARAEDEAVDAADVSADISTLEPGTVLEAGAPPPRPVVGPGSDMCSVRITKTGQGQVHTGATGTGVKKTYDWRDVVVLPREVGLALEGRSFGEILD